MNTKLLFLFSFTLLFSSVSYQLDTKLSSLEWVGSKVTGSHNGLIDFDFGSITLVDGDLTEAKLRVDMNTIRNLDIESEKYRKYLEDHLKDDDFFGVDSFPSSEIIYISSDEGYKADNKLLITCDLIIKGIKNRITFPITSAINDSTAVFSGSVNIDRTIYDIKYKSKSFFPDIGDAFIYDEFKINFNLVANQVK